MVLLEAMSHGVPCIAFDCETGPRHIITHNVDGYLVEKENPAKLAEAIEILIENEQKRKKFGAAAKENVRRFSSEVIINKWVNLFNDLLET
jgi:glycosyltransferase involved in cell wall biosynthesis